MYNLIKKLAELPECWQKMGKKNKFQTKKKKEKKMERNASIGAQLK